MSDPSRSGNWEEVNKIATNRHDTYPAISPEKADLSGTSVFITGASKGVGRTTAIRFAAAGCSKIGIGARSPLAEVEAAIKQAALAAGRPPPLVVAVPLDVASEDSVRRAAETVGAAFGGSLDMLINNAGYLETWRPVAEADPADWWRSWEINVKGTFLACRFFLPLVLRSPSGLKTVVNLSSVGAHCLAPGASAYQTARFATCRLTEHVERDYREQGLIAVALHPGGIKTELALGMPEYMHAVLIDEPELPADVMVWLARERREWLSGRFVSSCWDVEELEAKKEDIVGRDLLKFRMTI